MKFEHRRFPIGAELQPRGGVHFRLWAPKRQRVEVVLEGGGASALQAEDKGYFSGAVARASAGSLYRFRLDGGDYLYPDPASRFQPQGPHGPSQVVDPAAFTWSDAHWRGCQPGCGAIYEMHIGTFTPEGTWQAAQRQLSALVDLGITVLEVMPVAAFPGQFGWGYDGVDLFAPTQLYGSPNDFRRFVDAAHAAGLGVILDVVYNHIGPDGNYLHEFSADYFTDRYDNEWGDAINFDGDHAGPVREFFVTNAAYWIDEYHLDGLRLDATQQIFDRSPQHILAEVAQAVQRAARGRTTFLVAENEHQEARLARPLPEGYGLNAAWNDDFHHSARVALTGRREAYYCDYRGNPQEFLSQLKRGFLYQGQRSSWQKKHRGTPALDLPPAAFVVFLENHDQISNSGRGWRLHQLASPGRLRALTALLLLGPNTPMLFQGQEFWASAPFLFFADHRPELARAVSKGRHKFLCQFPSLATDAMQPLLADPADVATFQRCKLDLDERDKHAAAYALHRDLLRLRREDPVFRSRPPGSRIDGAVLGPDALLVRFFGSQHDDRLLLMNLGRDLDLSPAPEPLLVPPEGASWSLLWSSEDPAYGGQGTAELNTEETWKIPGEATVVLVAQGRLV
jgi:maltooligosyltrehalose trehalohydrolase